MISRKLLFLLRHIVLGLFILALSIHGFLSGEMFTKLLFVTSGALGLLNVIYAVCSIKSNTD